MANFIDKGIVKGAGWMKMDSRINYYKVAPKAMEHIIALEKYTRKTNIDRKLRELIKLRVSLINGCEFCIDMHTKGAKKAKATDEEIEQLTSWQDSTLFSPKEKVAFELAEHVTLIAEKGVDDNLYERVREHYDEQEYVDLIIIINQINTWNRLSISMGQKV